MVANSEIVQALRAAAQQLHREYEAHIETKVMYQHASACNSAEKKRVEAIKFKNLAAAEARAASKIWQKACKASIELLDQIDREYEEAGW